MGVDLVVDVVGGDSFTDSLRCLGPLGRLLVVGFTGGSIPQVKVNRLLLNNVDVRGVGWGAYAMARPGFMKAQWDDLLAADGLRRDRPADLRRAPRSPTSAPPCRRWRTARPSASPSCHR